MLSNNVGLNVRLEGKRSKESVLQFVDTQMNHYNYKEIDGKEVERLSQSRDINYAIMSAPRDSKAWLYLKQTSHLVKSKRTQFFLHEVE